MFPNGPTRTTEARFSNWLLILGLTLLAIISVIMFLIWLFIVPPGTRNLINEKISAEIDTNGTTNSAQFTITGISGNSYTFSNQTKVTGDGALCEVIGTTAVVCPFEANIVYVTMSLLFPSSATPAVILYGLNANSTVITANVFSIPASAAGFFEETTLMGVGLPSYALITLGHLTASPPTVLLGTLTIAEF